MKFRNYLNELLKLEDIEDKIYKESAVPFHSISSEPQIQESLNRIDELRRHYIKMIGASLYMHCQYLKDE